VAFAVDVMAEIWRSWGERIQAGEGVGYRSTLNPGLAGREGGIVVVTYILGQFDTAQDIVLAGFWRESGSL